MPQSRNARRDPRRVALFAGGFAFAACAGAAWLGSLATDAGGVVPPLLLAAAGAGIAAAAAGRAARNRAEADGEACAEARGAETLLAAGAAAPDIHQQIEEMRMRYRDQIARTARLREKLNGEIRRRTAELVRANRELEKVDRLKDEFISLLAHELRTPLTSVRSYVEILLGYGDSVSPDEQRHFLEVVRHQIQRLTRLINELLDLSRIRSGRFELAMTAVPVAPLLGEVFDEFNCLARETDHRLELRQAAEDLCAHGDRDRLVQILTNLVGNALKYSPAGCHVKIGTEERAAGEVAISVCDNGPGIPAEEAQTVFEPFYRTRSAGQSNVEGTGLGLYLSRELARQMGGDLLLEENADGSVGARFLVVLRAAEPARAAESVDENTSEFADA